MPVTAEETTVVALSLVQPTKNATRAHCAYMNNLVYILLRCALSANTKNSRVCHPDGSKPDLNIHPIHLPQIQAFTHHRRHSRTHAPPRVRTHLSLGSGDHTAPWKVYGQRCWAYARAPLSAAPAAAQTPPA